MPNTAMERPVNAMVIQIRFRQTECWNRSQQNKNTPSSPVNKNMADTEAGPFAEPGAPATNDALGKSA